MDNIYDFNSLFAARTLHPQVSVIDLSCADFTFFKKKQHDLYILVFIENIKGEITKDDTEVVFESSSIITFRPGLALDLKIEKDTQPLGWILAFKPELLEKTGLGRDFYMFTYFNSDYDMAISLNPIEFRVIRNCFANLYAELNTPQDHLSGQMIRLGIGTLLSYVKRYFEKYHTAHSDREQTFCERLERLLEKNLRCGQLALQGLPTVAWCAMQFNLSPNYFGDLIKKEVHITAQDYIKSLLINHAKVLLRQTNMTINEIAEELGFRYPNHFTRMFHKATGQTPLKYRKGI
jgi:AraC-like DNA-binding protein